MSNPILAVHCPIRIDLAGGWADQAQWRGPAAVLHGAFGWEHAGGGPQGHYPLTVRAGGNVRSCLTGVGTGLGVSSILRAADALLQGQDFREAEDAALQWEDEQGTRGGWQDAVGALRPGFKLTTCVYGERPVSQSLDSHPLVSHLVLFDTKQRREAKALGDLVRAQMGMPRFQAWMQTAVAGASRIARTLDPEPGALQCIDLWRNLCAMFPAMQAKHPLPESPNAWGSKLVGAGGGGYGVAFAKSPEQRHLVCLHYHSLGVWAAAPILLPGVDLETAAPKPVSLRRRGA